MPPRVPSLMGASEATMAPNRRIGERVFVGLSQLTWSPVPSRDAGTRYVFLMDLSVTGAGVFGPTHPEVRIGDRVVVGFNDSRAVVSVRCVSRTDVSELCYYRVEFVLMEPGFERDVFEVIGRARERRPRR